jgi:hypothetical protein
MNSMLAAEAAILVQFQTVGRILLVFNRVVVSLLALVATQCNANAHNNGTSCSVYLSADILFVLPTPSLASLYGSRFCYHSTSFSVCQAFFRKFCPVVSCIIILQTRLRSRTKWNMLTEAAKREILTGNSAVPASAGIEERGEGLPPDKCRTDAYNRGAYPKAIGRMAMQRRKRGTFMRKTCAGTVP